MEGSHVLVLGHVGPVAGEDGEGVRVDLALHGGGEADLFERQIEAAEAGEEGEDGWRLHCLLPYGGAA